MDGDKPKSKRGGYRPGAGRKRKDPSAPKHKSPSKAKRKGETTPAEAAHEWLKAVATTPLKRPRHEKFAQGIAAGLTNAKAYEEAGYEPASRDGADASASRLLAMPQVSERVRQLQTALSEIAIARSAETIEKLTDELNLAFAMAHEQERPDRMVAAIVAIARLNGLIVDKSESSVTHKHEEALPSVQTIIAQRRKAREGAGDDPIH